MVDFRFIGRAGRRKDRRALITLDQLEDRCTPSAVMLAPTYRLFSQHPSIAPQSGPGSQYGYTPSQLLQAYGFNAVNFQSNGSSIAGNGKGQTIVIVDAYDDPNIASDLTAFDQAFGLPAPPTFTKIGIDAQGNPSTSNFPSPDPNWSIEISLDAEWAHAIAPAANIVVVEALAADLQDLVNAVQYAGSYPGASVVSMSWGGLEFAGQDQYDSIFTAPQGHAGVTFVASSGDSGAGVIWPSVSSHVVAAGGTTLNLDSTGNYQSESGWNGSGGGVSSFTAAPGYQKNLQIYSGDPAAGGMRAVPDIAYDADPNTGVPVYATYGNNGWLEVGGTSAAAPQWAALFAIADQGRALHGLGSLDSFTQTLPDLYQAPASDFHDITTGNNGYPAGAGFDEVTGLGSPVANQLMSALGAPLVQQVLTSVTIAPANPTVGDGGQEQFTATGLDQFGNPMVPQPSFSWQLVSGQGTFTTSAVYTAPTTGSGTATIQVTATEGSATVNSTTNVNYRPGPAISGLSASPNPVQGTTTTLRAQLADPNGGNLSYSWSVVSAPSGAAAPTLGTASGSTVPGSVSTTATFSQAGAYLFQLSVTDALNVNVTSTVLVNVAPTITSVRVTPSNTAVNDGGQLQFTATADDQFGNALSVQPSFSWSVLSGGLGTITSTGLYTAPSAGNGTDTVQATTTVNGTTYGGTATAAYSVGLAITSMAADPNPIAVGSTTMLSAQISDTHTSLVRFTWIVVSAPAGAPAPEVLPPIGMAIVGTLTGSGTFYAPGTYVLELDVSDSFGATASDTLTVNVGGVGLAITSLTANPNPVTGNTTTLTAQLSDAPSATINYNWVVVAAPLGAPAPELLPPSGTASAGTLTATAAFSASGTYTIELDVSDSLGQTASDTLTVNVGSAGVGLAIASLTANPNPVVGATGALTAQVSDASAASIFFNWTVLSAPPGVPAPMVTPAFGNAPVSNPLTATVTYYAAGTYEFQLQVGDSTGQSATDTVTVMVDAATPTIALTANPSPVTGTTTTLSGAITDANQLSSNYQYRWSIVSAPPTAPLPTFANPSSGTAINPIANTATFYAAGTYEFQLAVTDDWGITATATVNVTVNPMLTTVTLTPPTATLAQGAAQQLTAQAYDQFHQLLGPQPTFNWLLASGPGTVSSTGLYRAPTAGTGTAIVQAMATVAGVSVGGRATITVTGPAPVIAHAGANPSPVTGTTTTLSVTASDPSHGTLSYAWSVLSKPSGAPPPSLGRATAATTGATFYQAGAYTFRVVVTSSVSGASHTATVSVTVAQTLTRVTVSPASNSVRDNESLQFLAYAYDQFLHRIDTKFAWSKASGSGTVTSTGMYTAPGTGSGRAIVKATASVNGITIGGSATVSYS